MEKKEEKWSKRRAVSGWIGTLEKIRFAEVERERFFITKTQ
ncbi:hypothetical protein T10_4789 [Trichinella papuae]|uniref:Uncharacterized protein n=1 Tax=Trichinella papuae TaxID=268474 RepID=A0A0V1LW64_9BILA|nr:hypothetical protein T10_11794 [Trichinella papuae]KRZ63676.1 hypothetical protein T10_4789 [Trichinella papuae]